MPKTVKIIEVKSNISSIWFNSICGTCTESDTRICLLFHVYYRTKCKVRTSRNGHVAEWFHCTKILRVVLKVCHYTASVVGSGHVRFARGTFQRNLQWFTAQFYELIFYKTDVSISLKRARRTRDELRVVTHRCSRLLLATRCTFQI